MATVDLSVRNRLNNVDPNVLAQLLQKTRLGDVLGLLASDAAVEETVTVASHVGTLPRRALVVYAVSATAGTYTGAITLVPPSQTPTTKTAKLATDRKTFTFATADAVTEAKVLYLPAPDLETVLANPL
jgi:hypothetical protein